MGDKSPFETTPSPTFIVCSLFDDDHSDGCEAIPHGSFDCISLRINDVEHPFMCLWASSLEN